MFGIFCSLSLSLSFSLHNTIYVNVYIYIYTIHAIYIIYTHREREREREKILIRSGIYVRFAYVMFGLLGGSPIFCKRSFTIKDY